MRAYLTGLVAKKLVAEGSKSEHEAVVLITSDKDLPLRRPEGNPFNDEILNLLVGKEISCQGEIHQGQLILSSWEEKS